jgi:hypothetical protein
MPPAHLAPDAVLLLDDAPAKPPTTKDGTG